MSIVQRRVVTDATTTRPTGGPTGRGLLREGVVAAVAQPVATGTAALVVALVCVVVLVTTGRTAAVERDVVAAVDGTGTRTVTVTDTTGNAGIRPESVAAVAALEGVTWAFGLGAASDARTVDGTSGVPVREFVGPLSSVVTLTGGRLPQRPGEAVAGSTAADRLRLVDGAGPVAVEHREVPVVGEFRADGALARLDDAVLMQLEDDADATLRYVYVLVDSAAQVPSVAQAVAAVLSTVDPAQVEVTTSDGLIALRDVVSGSLGAGARQLMAGVLAAGILLIAIVMLGAVAARRRDFGRRRALGASRSAVIVLVLVHSGVAALVGTSVGTGVGLLAVTLSAGAAPAPSFTAGLAALTVLVTLAGSVPPALAAAWRDPVRVLRVP